MSLIVSFSNPGFYKPEQRELDKDSSIKMLVATISDRNFMLKYCKTCKIVKDVRVFHCKYCNLCIMRHDHHCPWLSNCIGINNHKKFILLLNVVLLHSGLQFYICNRLHSTFDLTSFEIKLQPLFSNFFYLSTITLSLITFIFFILILFIIFFQIKFICNNETTSENIRRIAYTCNPYNRGCKSNIKEFLYDMEGFKEIVTYNEVARDYLMTTCLITEYYSILERKSLQNRISTTSNQKIDKEYFDTSNTNDSMITSDKILNIDLCENKC